MNIYEIWYKTNFSNLHITWGSSQYTMAIFIVHTHRTPNIRWNYNICSHFIYQFAGRETAHKHYLLLLERWMGHGNLITSFLSFPLCVCVSISPWPALFVANNSSALRLRIRRVDKHFCLVCIRLDSGDDGHWTVPFSVHSNLFRPNAVRFLIDYLNFNATRIFRVQPSLSYHYCGTSTHTHTRKCICQMSIFRVSFVSVGNRCCCFFISLRWQAGNDIFGMHKNSGAIILFLRLIFLQLLRASFQLSHFFGSFNFPFAFKWRTFYEA